MLTAKKKMAPGSETTLMHILNVGDQICPIEYLRTKMSLDKYIGTKNANKPFLSSSFLIYDSLPLKPVSILV